MAIGWPFYDPSWWPTDAPEAEGRADEPEPLPDEMLDLDLVRAVIEDGLLMVFGPDADPIPPEIFRAAAAERPHAGIPLRDGPRVAAERIAAVLEAQSGGRLGSGESGADAWIRAMLGIGAPPEVADPQDLQAEECAVQVMAFGKELLITSPTGATFLLTEARSRFPDSVGLRLADEGPIAVSDLVGRLLAGPGGRQGDDVGSGALASVFMSSGETASLDDMVRALHQPAAALPEPAAAPVQSATTEPEPVVALVQSATTDPEPAMAPVQSAATEPEPVTASFQPAATDPEPVMASFQSAATGPEPVMTPVQSAATGPEPVTASFQLAATGPEPAMASHTAAPRHSVPLRIDLPDALAAAPDHVALVVIRGVPEAASLSAGVAGGDGSWLLSPRNLAGLSLTPPPPDVDLPLEVVAIAVAGQDGELTSASRTVIVPSAPDPVDLAMAPIPLALDPEELCARGPFDAVLVLDVPAGAALSAGTYDPEIGAWILLPRQLAEVSLIPGSTRERDFTLSLMGVCMQSGGQASPRVLAQVPVTVR